MLARQLCNPFVLDDFFTESWIHTPNFAELLQVKNEDGSLTTTVDLPGVAEKDITVEVSPKGFVTVKGETKTKTSSRIVKRSFSVPKDCDSEQLKAELKDGVLTLTMPGKALPAEKEVKKITVTTVK